MVEAPYKNDGKTQTSEWFINYQPHSGRPMAPQNDYNVKNMSEIVLEEWLWDENGGEHMYSY